jgi:hypothetical protein
MIRRRIIRSIPEGVIETPTAATCRRPISSDNQTDLNRNFPYRALDSRRSAGAFPLSEMESRSLSSSKRSSPEIFSGSTCTTSAAFASAARRQADEDESGTSRQQLGAAEELTYQWCRRREFLCRPDTIFPHGDPSDRAYHQRRDRL